jgi:hypothetical protein
VRLFDNLGVALLIGAFPIPAVYTRHTMQQALSIGVGSRRRRESPQIAEPDTATDRQAVSFGRGEM